MALNGRQTQLLLRGQLILKPTVVRKGLSISQSLRQSFQREASSIATQRNHKSSTSESTLAPNRSNALRSYATTSSDIPQIMVNDLRHQEVLVAFNDDHTVRYPSFWLRDHCQCSECAHPHTKQRQVDTFQLDADIKATKTDPEQNGLHIEWSQEDHKSLYPWSWLREHIPFSASPNSNHPRSDWQQIAPHSPQYPTVKFDDVMNTNSELSGFLFNIRTFGFCFIADTPPTPEATQSLLERLAFIRVTHYGGFWDFTSEAKPIDTAYTNLALPAHTDNTYFTDPCGLQLFHCLEPASEGGGESTFVDGFAAAKQLYTTNPEYYNILSSVRIAAHASGDANQTGSVMNTAAHPSGYPVFTHAVPHTRPNPKSLTQIRWNNADRHSSTQWPSHERMIMWYRAARAWNEILASPEFEITVQLQPGCPVIFDNWRVLHGRKAFQGTRRMCGGYIGMDDFLARGRSLDLNPKRREEVYSDLTESSGQSAREQLTKYSQTKEPQISPEGGRGMTPEEKEQAYGNTTEDQEKIAEEQLEKDNEHKKPQEHRERKEPQISPQGERGMTPEEREEAYGNATENEEKIAQEQLEEEEEQKKDQKKNVEPDVTPQRKDGVDIPIAS